MPFLPVATVHLFPGLRNGLVELLQGLTEDQWSRPTICGDWTVQDLAAHLVGVDLGNIAVRRDRHVASWPGDWDLAVFNERWVEACRRLSARELIDLAQVSGEWFESYLATINPDEMGRAPGWAGGGAAPVWLDIAREYTERWVHQQQIRAAVAVPGLDDGAYAGPVIATFVHALPVALQSVDAPVGTVAVFRVTGPGGGVWNLVRTSTTWDLRNGDAPDAAAVVTTESRAAWRRMTNDRTAPAATIEGDPVIGERMAESLAILV